MTLTENARAPQQDRSRETRDLILETTLRALARIGWNATTTSVVAVESGVSRGAIQHHFPTKEALMRGVLEYMYESRNTSEFSITAEVPADVDRFEYIAEQVLHYYASDHFKAALQMWTAAIGDPEFSEQLQLHGDRLARAVYDRVVVVLNADTSDLRTHRLIQTTLDLSRGLGLADVLRDDSRRRKSVAKFWASELRSIVQLAPGAAVAGAGADATAPASAANTS